MIGNDVTVAEFGVAVTLLVLTPVCQVPNDLPESFFFCYFLYRQLSLGIDTIRYIYCSIG